MKDTDQETGQTKVCSKCREEKSLYDFYKSKKERLGVMSHCKACDKAKGAAYYKANAKKVNARVQAGREADPEKKKRQDRQWYENNKEANYARALAWRRANPERSREFTKNWEKRNPGSSRERNRKRLNTPIGRLENCIRAGFHRGLVTDGKKGRKTFQILGYTAQALKAHLESLFEPGMTWDNHGRGRNCWHIDHVIPLSAFNITSPDDIDFKRAWALSNLRPLWELDNLSKGAKLTTSFQPSLPIRLPCNDNVQSTLKSSVG